jgi:hypothetical protein
MLTAYANPTRPDLVMAVELGPIPRVALTREEAAASIGMSLSSFERYVQPEIRLIRRGGLRVVPVAELARWAEGAAESLP